jgi:hypothetical protein
MWKMGAGSVSHRSTAAIADRLGIPLGAANPKVSANTLVQSFGLCVSD